jgi:hypothetical protein
LCPSMSGGLPISLLFLDITENLTMREAFAFSNLVLTIIRLGLPSYGGSHSRPGPKCPSYYTEMGCNRISQALCLRKLRPSLHQASGVTYDSSRQMPTDKNTLGIITSRNLIFWVLCVQ